MRFREVVTTVREWEADELEHVRMRMSNRGYGKQPQLVGEERVIAVHVEEVRVVPDPATALTYAATAP